MSVKELDGTVTKEVTRVSYEMSVKQVSVGKVRACIMTGT